MAVTHSEVGQAGAAGWSESFRRSELGAAVFDVAPAVLPRVLAWVDRQPVPHATRRDVHAPSVDAWALLDGGVVHRFGYGLTTLPAGMHIVGLQAFRLIVAELGFAVPDGLTESSSVPPAELHRRLLAVPADDPSAVEQAELLASCTDAVLLRWVATTLLAEYGTSGAGH